MNYLLPLSYSSPNLLKGSKISGTCRNFNIATGESMARICFAQVLLGRMIMTKQTLSKDRFVLKVQEFLSQLLSKFKQLSKLSSVGDITLYEKVPSNNIIMVQSVLRYN